MSHTADIIELTKVLRELVPDFFIFIGKGILVLSSSLSSFFFKMSSPNEIKGDLAAKVNFPLYAVKMLTDRHFVVAGGGGAARTGVANGFVISV